MKCPLKCPCYQCQEDSEPKCAHHTTPSTKVGDRKAGIGTKPPLSHTPLALEIYVARAHQFGGDKYGQVGNYLTPPPEGVEDVERLLEYISACRRHLSRWSLSIIRYLGDGKGCADSLREACYAVDKDSGLPHACGAAASLGMALQQAVDAGLMPEDPGVTWDRKGVRIV